MGRNRKTPAENTSPQESLYDDEYDDDDNGDDEIPATLGETDFFLAARKHQDDIFVFRPNEDGSYDLDRVIRGPINGMDELFEKIGERGTIMFQFTQKGEKVPTRYLCRFRAHQKHSEPKNIAAPLPIIPQQPAPNNDPLLINLMK